jgi:tRNA-specific 2-thiouridylase
VACNGVLKFRLLLERARTLGATHLATGHYARCTADGRLLRAADAEKDQSYFLFPVRPDALRQTVFPLGGLTKPEVRAHARRLGLATADKEESQEVCFIPDDDHARFVREHRPDAGGGGEIADESGRVLGRTDAWWRFTVGQRRGLGVAAGRPVHVLRVEPERRRVVVGPAERLETGELRAAGINWFRRPRPGELTAARVRHRGALHPCEVEEQAAGTMVVRFPERARAVAPGQAVVVYARDEVLCGGWIQRPPRAETAP